MADSDRYERWLQRNTQHTPYLFKYKDIHEGIDVYKNAVEELDKPIEKEEEQNEDDNEEEEEYFGYEEDKLYPEDVKIPDKEEKEVKPVIYELKQPYRLVSLAASVLVNKRIGKDALNYAAILSNLPQELAEIVISQTSPCFVEALATLRNKQREANNGEPIVGLMRMLYAIEEYELMYLTNIKHNIPIGTDWSPPLIDVWKHYDTFILEPESDEEKKIGKICFSKAYRPNNNERLHSVADEETFTKNFAVFTENQFQGWAEWDNMIVIGGSVVGSLMEVPLEYRGNEATYFHQIAYPTSDIDVYIYGLSVEDFAKKVNKLYQHLTSIHKEVVVVRTEFTVTFCTQWPNRHIQIVIGKWNTIAEILFEPDIDCTCVAYDGSRLWATQRSRFSYNHRCIVASQNRYSARGFPEYEGRLIKYSSRGFCISSKKKARSDFESAPFKFILLLRRYLG